MMRPREDRNDLGRRRGCSDLVAPVLPSRDSVEGAILVVALFRGIGALWVCHPGNDQSRHSVRARLSPQTNGPSQSRSYDSVVSLKYLRQSEHDKG